jgi:hypothetical protein
MPEEVSVKLTGMSSLAKVSESKDEKVALGTGSPQTAGRSMMRTTLVNESPIP